MRQWSYSQTGELSTGLVVLIKEQGNNPGGQIAPGEFLEKQ